MRRRHALTSVFVFTPLILASHGPAAAATGDWEGVYPTTSVEWFFGIDIYDANRIAVVGSSSMRLISTDGGATWNQQSLGVSFGPLYDVAWLDA